MFPLWHKMLLWVELRIPFAVVILQNHHNHCQLSVLLQSLFLPLLTHYWQRRRRRGVGEDRMQRSECNKKAWQGLLDQIAFNKTVANLQICHQHNHQNSLSQHPRVPVFESFYEKGRQRQKIYCWSHLKYNLLIEIVPFTTLTSVTTALSWFQLSATWEENNSSKSLNVGLRPLTCIKCNYIWTLYLARGSVQDIPLNLKRKGSS